MTTESKKKTSKTDMIVAFLGTLADIGRNEYADKHLPQYDLGDYRKARDGDAQLWRQLFRTHLHEAGHEAVMLHIDPKSAPEVIVDAEPAIFDEGVGVKIDGGGCGTARPFTEPHDSIMISAAGWYAETRALAHVLGEDSPMFAFTKMPASAALGLWINGAFDKTFDGCEKDNEHLQQAMRDWLPAEWKEGDADPSDADVAAASKDVARRAESAMDAAARVIDAQAQTLVRVAMERSTRQFLTLMEAAKLVSQGVDKARAAAMGLYGDEEIAARMKNKRGPKPHVWEGAK